MTVLPATLNLKVAPFQVLHFLSASHTADENGLVLNVPYDAAMVMINDPLHPAVEATAEDLAASAETAPAAAEVAPVPAIEAPAEVDQTEDTAPDAE